MKLIVGVLASASVVSLAGSISGTFAWLQYNTRDRVEFQGATTKCSENLQVRIVYKDGGNTAYGDWKQDLTNNDIMLAAKANDVSIVAGVGGDYPAKEFVPVTMPGVAQSAAAGTIYGHPACGYPAYNQWQKAIDSDYMRFSLQFRVLDVNGLYPEEGKAEAQLAMPLYLTDITFHDTSVAPSTDMTKALRVHTSCGLNNRLMAYDPDQDSEATISTATCGKLDLNKDGQLDTLADKPNHYTWEENNPETDYTLDYGGTLSYQKAHNLASADNAIYPVVKENGYIDATANASCKLGTTVAAAETDPVIPDASYLTVNFVVWLEGWQDLGDGNMTGKDNTIWAEEAAIGATFDIGMSFAVSTLRDIA